MAVEYDEKETRRFSGVPTAPPPPSLSKKTPLSEGKNLMKSAATLIGDKDDKIVKETALDVCQNFLRRNLSDSGKKTEERSLAWYYRNNDVESHLQDGPTCGLVALKLAADILKNNRCRSRPTNTDEIHELLKLAQENGFTHCGEMFSAQDMGLLAERYYELKFEVRKNCTEGILVKHLCQGYPVLVPYDADRNHEPCLKRGQKSHWAVITGFLIGLERENILQTDTHSSHDSVPLIYQFHHDETVEIPLQSKHLFVLARQGKSRHYAMWSWDELSSSNKNLFEFNLDKKDLSSSDSEVTKCIFTEGIQAGLCSKVVFLFP